MTEPEKFLNILKHFDYLNRLIISAANTSKTMAKSQLL